MSLSLRIVHPRRRRLMVILFVVAGVGVGPGFAQDTAPVDPQVARLNAETARLEANRKLLEEQNKLSQQRFGAPATPPQGTISGADKLGSLGDPILWTELDHTLAEEIKLDVTCDASSEIFITSDPVAGERIVHARFILEQIDKLSERAQDLEDLLKPSEALGVADAGVRALTGPTLLSAIGFVDSLVGLFRTDYAIAEVAVTVQPLTLKLAAAVHTRAHCPNARVVVDGLASDAPANLTGLYAKAIELQRHVDDLRTFIKKADEITEVNAFVTRTQGLLTALYAADASTGIPPIHALAKLSALGEHAITLYVAVDPPKTVSITKKRLLSRNDRVTFVGTTRLTVATASLRAAPTESPRIAIVPVTTSRSVSLRTLTREDEGGSPFR